VTAKTMHRSEADLRAALTALAERYEEIVDRAPRHPQWISIPPLSIGQRAEHDRAIGYRNAARAIRDILRTGQLPNDLPDNSGWEDLDPRQEAGR
jgi:hypothetical protein